MVNHIFLIFFLYFSMSNVAKLVILDQVNVKFEGLSPECRRDIVAACKLKVPWARNTPQFKMGRWDGTVSFATVGGGTFINMLDVVLPIVQNHGYSLDLDDRRPVYNFKFPEVDENLLAHKCWPEGHPAAGQPIIIRDYQVEAIKNYLTNLQSLQVITTGGGKTITTAALSTLVEPYGRSLIIVPSKSLVEQTEEDYKNVGLDVGVFYGDRKEWNCKHTICTWQSLGAFDKRGKGGILEPHETIYAFLKDVVCVMVDEVHSAKADVLKNLLTGPMANIPIRWGLTGTVPKEDFNERSLICSLGKVVGRTTAKSLQDRGLLSNCKIDILQLDDSHQAPFKSYADEYKYLTTDKDRLTYMSKVIDTIKDTGNTLVLVDRIETGEFIVDYLGEENAVFISGKMKTKNRTVEFKEIQKSDNRVIVATFGVAAVGINVPRLFNVVLIEAGKSFVRVIQSIGRGLRTAQDKDFVNIYDFTSSMKHSKKHLTERKKFYKEAEYPFEVIKVKYK